MPFTKDSARDDITEELLRGATPGQLSKRYPVKSVYRIYNELKDSGQLPEQGSIVVDGEYPFAPASSSASPQMGQQMGGDGEKSPSKTGAEVLDFTGPKGLPIEAVNRIRGVLGISLRPKVLSCPTPELLYPAMVIAVTEFGFPPMRPDDFIDTVLYQWLDACDIIPYAFMKKSELEELTGKYNATSEEIIKDEEFRKKHGLVTTDEIRQAVFEPLAEKEKEAASEIEDEPPEDLGEPEELTEEDEVEQAPFLKQVEEDIGAIPEPEPVEPQPHEPTVGELLSGLHINNIRKEIGENGSAGRIKSDSP